MKMYPMKFFLAQFHEFFLFSLLVGIWKLRGFVMRTLPQSSSASGDTVGMTEAWTDECSQ
jgi:hypothetical protein